MAIEINKGRWTNEQAQKEKDLKLQLVSEVTEEEVAIEAYIREQYPLSRELALHRKKAMGVLSQEEWDEYVAFVQECINKVRNGAGQ